MDAEFEQEFINPAPMHGVQENPLWQDSCHPPVFPR